MENLFETTSVETRVEHRYRLANKDLKWLRPMIRQENAAILMLFGLCSNNTSTDYMSLWNALRRQRVDFERTDIVGLTTRQQLVLRSARAELEARVLDEWLDNYLKEIAPILDLDWYQSTYVDKVFQTEENKRLKLLANAPGDQGRFEVAWQKLSDEREGRIELILDPDQLRDYRGLAREPDGLIAAYIRR
ncbi:MAG: hypothetical protein ACJ73D_08200 [Pyrinomonadaceae bacterium]